MFELLGNYVYSIKDILFSPISRKRQIEQHREQSCQRLTTISTNLGKRKLNSISDQNGTVEPLSLSKRQKLESNFNNTAVFATSGIPVAKMKKTNVTIIDSASEKMNNNRTSLATTSETTRELMNLLKKRNERIRTGKIEHEKRREEILVRKMHEERAFPALTQIDLKPANRTLINGKASKPSDEVKYAPIPSKFASSAFLFHPKKKLDSVLYEKKKDEEYISTPIVKSSHIYPSLVEEEPTEAIDEKLAFKINSIETLRERVRLMSLSKDISKDRFASEITASLITSITDELSKQIAYEAIREEMPSVVFDKILAELIEENIEELKEFIELASIDEETVRNLLYRTGRNHIIINKYKVDMTRDKLECLTPTEWLNDEVINFYFNMCMERASLSPGKYPDCHFMSTFFYSKLTNNNRTYFYPNVKRWTKNVDLFSKDKVIIPVHLGMHWVLAVINIRDRRLEYYDSMLHETHTASLILENLRRYIQDEHQDKKKAPYDTSDWEIYIASRSEYPQQSNGYDCGMFTCKCGNYISQDKQINFSQRDMQYFRDRKSVV